MNEKSLERIAKELLSLVDGVYEIVELYQPKFPAQEKWKKDWLAKARSFGAGPEDSPNHYCIFDNIRNIYRIEQKQNAGPGVFYSALVVAPDIESARDIHPGLGYEVDWSRPDNIWGWATDRDAVSVELVGKASIDWDGKVILMSKCYED